MKALAIFHNKGNHWADKWLKEGFKHVFVVIQDEHHWIRIDAQVGVPKIEIVADACYDLERYYQMYEGEKMTVVETETSNEYPRWPLTVYNCVGMVKIVLGVRCMAFTPYQLYCHLRLKSVCRSLESALSLPGKSLFVPEKPKTAAAPPAAPKETSPEVEGAGERSRIAELQRKGRRAAIFTGGQGVQEELGIVTRPRARAAQVFGVPGSA